MQTAESVCLWNYQFKNNYSKSSSPSSINIVSSGKIIRDSTLYLACTERLACRNEMSSRASYFCIECNTLQCSSCDKELHECSVQDQHERLDLHEITDESCSVDRRHPAIFYCSTCTQTFCYSCYENQHQHSDGRQHKLQKYRQGRIHTRSKTDT
jgi:hypothetical protein